MSVISKEGSDIVEPTFLCILLFTKGQLPYINIATLVLSTGTWKQVS